VSSIELIDQVLAAHCADAVPGRYSGNLYDWLERAQRKYAGKALRWWGVYAYEPGVVDCDSQVFAWGSCTASWLYIGMTDGEGYLYGSRLSEVITLGREVSRWAYPLLGDQALDITDAFWSRYLQQGKCAFDAGHLLYRDEDRYVTEGDRRQCQWCQRVELRAETFDLPCAHKAIWRVVEKPELSVVTGR
jgi:hypothetical protein